ncbi:MAG: hypothetical protein DBY37_15100 [Desulfovibrionaceae bacterium]|nr:MAG: hypothetical protein DBY37_15100 [Desulfovibrionaceae bacterium]
MRGAYRFTPAQAAIFIAARQPVFHSPLPPCRITVRRGDAPQFAALAPPVVKDMFNTVFYDRAKGFHRHCRFVNPFTEEFPVKHVFRLALLLCLRMAFSGVMPEDAPASEAASVFSAEKEVDGRSVRADIGFPRHAAVEETVPLNVALSFERQISGAFPSVSVTWRKLPDGASAPEVLPGVPVTDIRFSVPGHYEMEAEVGLVFRNSCGGIRLVPLAAASFAVDVF